MEKKEFFASMEAAMPLFSEQLANGKSVIFSPRGVSMRPLIRQGKDSVVISPITESPAKYDIIFYRYPDGKYVLHRIVKVTEDGYLCLGDNTYWYETVKNDYVLAVVTAFRRGRRQFDVSNRWYRLYCRIWVTAFPLRKFAKRAIGWIWRRIKK